MKCEAALQACQLLSPETSNDSLWSEMHGHLSECLFCLEAAEMAGLQHCEFIKLNHLPVPEALSRLEVEEAVKVAQQPLLIHERKISRLKLAAPQIFWISGAILFAAGSFMVVRSFIHIKNEKAPVSAQASERNQKAYREIERIAKEVGVEFDEQGNPIKTGPVLASGVDIKPLYFHLKFQSESQAEVFKTKLASISGTPLFQSETLLTVMVTRAQILKSIPLIKEHLKHSGEKLSVFSKLPIFDGRVRVSFYLDRQFQHSEAMLLYQHWYFYFQLTNRLQLYGRLKSIGVKMIYEMPEIWVFETPAHTLTEIKDSIKDTPGLNAEGINLKTLPRSGNRLVRISVYLDGR